MVHSQCLRKEEGATLMISFVATWIRFLPLLKDAKHATELIYPFLSQFLFLPSSLIFDGALQFTNSFHINNLIYFSQLYEVIAITISF